MIVITGSAGFIASCLVAKLNQEGYTDLVLVDHFEREDKKKNYSDKIYSQLVDRENFAEWLDTNHKLIQFVFHLGARTETTLFDIDIFNHLNLNFSKMVWTKCKEYGLPMVYASSAATYGDGSLGYKDEHSLSSQLHPLNPYGDSKNDFDKWALEQTEAPYFWAGLKFFNVYGPNEYHKGRMASVIMHTYNQIKANGSTKLFRSHNPNYKDGEQMRDFIYVKDVCDVLFFLLHHRKDSGIYNLGSGKARTFLDLAKNVFTCQFLEPNIEFIDTPIDIRDKYQYFTEADMSKLIGIGYNKPFHSLEDGIKDYVVNYLQFNEYM
ncbi:MAG: ADP-glyceromanno-heptose 6-epimerase [Bacteroidetes bacterium]|nr:ADP-glyceromanno-heptose 6-epimerase [Bacteroidota bacterium]